jgi:nitrite reductase (NO-forming)
MASVVLAAGFLVSALVAALASTAGAPLISPWLPLHLALAGGASTAIAGVMPFFVAALAAGAPAPARLRGGAVAMVAAGAALVSVRGIDPAAAWAPVTGGVVYLAGIGAVALAVRASGRAGLMMRRPVVTLGYMLALANVAIGAIIGTLAVAGWAPVLERWAQLRPAHAWANVVGYVSLVIVATLLHFLPTVLGGRIVPRQSAAVAVLGTGMGVPVVVVGLLVGSGPVAGGGGILALVGALAMALEAVQVVRADRGRWTTDPGWHRFASVGLLAGVAWFVLGISLATGLLVAHGATADAWSTPVVGAALAVGWVVGVLMASWTHLLPSIGPGGPVQHARQRVILGRVATTRLVAFNAGVALLAVGWPMGQPAMAGAGAALAGAAVLGSVVLAVGALRAGR